MLIKVLLSGTKIKELMVGGFNMDLRVKKTEKIIMTAFLELVMTEGFERVTVKAISERAMINRKTFYQHFTDKYAVTEKLTQDLLDWLQRALQKRGELVAQGKSFQQAFTALAPELTEFMTAWREPLQAMILIPTVRAELLQALQTTMRQQLETTLQRSVAPLEVNVVGGVTLGLLMSYLQNNQLPSNDDWRQLADSLGQVLGPILAAID